VAGHEIELERRCVTDVHHICGHVIGAKLRRDFFNLLGRAHLDGCNFDAIQLLECRSDLPNVPG